MQFIVKIYGTKSKMQFFFLKANFPVQFLGHFHLNLKLKIRNSLIVRQSENDGGPGKSIIVRISLP